MVTYFNKKDLINFGKYLLSEKRTKSITDNHPNDDECMIKERLSGVYDSDIANFIDSVKCF